MIRAHLELWAQLKPLARVDVNQVPARQRHRDLDALSELAVAAIRNSDALRPSSDSR